MFGKSSWKVTVCIAVAVTMMFAVVGCKKEVSGDKKNAAPAAAPSAVPSASAASAKSAFKPEKAITLIVPVAPGGSSDILARAIEKEWSKYCPQQLLVVNKSGAAGVDGANIVAKSKPDGYTMLISYGSGQDMIVPQLQKTPYDPIKDFAPVSLMSIVSIMVAVPADSAFKTLQDVIDFGKKEKKPITAAIATAGGTVDFVMRGIGKKAGIDIVPVPHQGSAQAITTLLGKQTMIGGGTPSEIMPHVKSGKLRALGVCFPERDPIVKDIPTFKEQGVDFSTWGALRGVAAAAGTPKEVIDYYADVFKKISEDAEFKKALDTMLQPVIYKGPEDFTKIYKETYEGYGKMIKELGIQQQ